MKIRFSVVVLATIASFLAIGVVRNETKKIVFVGDSITYGFRPGVRDVESTLSWPDAVQESLGEGYLCINEAYNSKKAVDVLDEFDEKVLAHHPDYLVVAIGVNDLRRGRTGTETVDSLSEIKSLCEANDIPCLFTTILPWHRCKYDSWTEQKQKYAEQVNEWILSNGGVNTYEHFVEDDGISMSRKYTTDGIHQSNDLFSLHMAEIVVPNMGI